MSRVAWEQATYAGQIGFVTIGQTRIKIASISYSTMRNDPKPWVLRTEIPGWKNARHHETTDDAKASVERILTTFTTAMRQAGEPTAQEIDQAASVAGRNVEAAQFGDFLHGFECAVRWLTVGRG